MKMTKAERRRRVAMTLVYSAIVLLVLLVTVVIVALVTMYLIKRGTLRMGDVELDTRGIILTMLLSSLVIGAGIAYVSTRFSMRPFTKAQITLDRLAAGDYSARLQFRGPYKHIPGMHDLAESINKTARELENTEMLRSDFINNFSHEFKTPIVSIAGFARLIKRGNLSPEKEKEYLDAIEEEATRLSRMATNVLSLSRVENRTILTDVRRYDLSEQLRTAMLMLEGKWTKKHIEPVLPAEEYYVEAEEKLCEQVWINLFENAIKFSPEYGTVEASIVQTPKETSVTVSNLGDPIPASKAARIFDRFYQGDESHATEGNGIGLAVVKKIVDLHGGSVQVSSHGERVYFTVTLPAGHGSSARGRR